MRRRYFAAAAVLAMAGCFGTASGETVSREAETEILLQEAETESILPEEETESLPQETESEEEEGMDSRLAGQILDLLGKDIYRDTLKELENGTVIGKGTQSDAGRGLQQLLIDLGSDIEADGAVGNMTIEALQSVLENYGIEKTDSVDAPLYRRLLAVLLAVTDEEAADGLLREYLEQQGDGYYEYLQGCALMAKEKYYSALENFQDCPYPDSARKALQCPQEWPQTGEIWRSDDTVMAEEVMELGFDVNIADPSLGMCFYIYKEGEPNELRSILFLGSSGTVKTMLPGGTYRIKDAAGTDWFGTGDAFGRNGSYEFLTFDEEGMRDEYSVLLEPGYSYTITIDVSAVAPDAENVGSYETDWESWIG